MINSRQRAQLRGMVNDMPSITQVGKQGVTPELVESIDEALEARELIKISVLQNCAEDPKAVAEMLSGRTRSDVVQVIGSKIALYRRSKDKPVIILKS